MRSQFEASRRALARLLRRLAEWLDPMPPSPVVVPEEVIPSTPLVPSGARHALERWERGEWRPVRAYKKGGEARDAFLAKKHAKTPGRYRLTTDGAQRDEFSNPE